MLGLAALWRRGEFFGELKLNGAAGRLTTAVDAAKLLAYMVAEKSAAWRKLAGVITPTEDIKSFC